MLELNDNLLEEDLGILLDGRQFKEAIEKGHHNEDKGMWMKGRNMHRKVGKLFRWKKANANQPIEKVAADIWRIVEKKFGLR